MPFTGLPTLAEATAEIPDWFGLELDPYQITGAVGVARGRTGLFDAPGLGKGSPASTRILTPTGWATYGDISVGDQVIGSDGKPTTVIGVFPRGELDVYRVTMSDRTSVVVDGDHLWSVTTKYERKRGAHPRVRSTREIMSEDLARMSGGNLQHVNYVPMVEPIHFESNRELPFEPWLIGFLLGDGSFTKSSVSFTTADQDVVDHVAELLPTFNIKQYGNPDSKRARINYGISRGKRPVANELVQYFRAVGLMGKSSWEKTIPDEYLFAPEPEQRLDLLRGLMDSDGTAGVAASFSSTSKTLAEQVAFLVESLGGNARIASRVTKYRDRDRQLREGRRSYLVTVTMPPELCPFWLPRKAEAWCKPWKYGPMRAISKIEPEGRANVICIAVDAPDQLYVTEHCIVTHNTRQFLAAAAILESTRTVITCPPVVTTAWRREADTSSLPTLGGRHAGETVVFVSGRKAPTIPDRGVVVIPDTLLQARPALLEQLLEWNPTLVGVDEAHRAKTWDSKRSETLRTLSANRTAVAITGTPMFANPVELAACLEIAGWLDFFGGYERFVSRYARQIEVKIKDPKKLAALKRKGAKTSFPMWVARREHLAELQRLLEEHVAVRRTKEEADLDLPPKRRTGLEVDVDLSAFREAHSQVEGLVDDWLNTLDGEPSTDAIRDWARSNMGLVTMLRRAAGVCKVPVAVNYIRDWVESTTHVDDDGYLHFERPLIVWTHHRAVSEMMAEVVPTVIGNAGVIIGGSTQEHRDRVIDGFQAGEIPVVICSIAAASTGITLNRSSDVLFVESDWTPALVSQAEDRSHRRGVKRPVLVTTLIASGTLDEHVQNVLLNKAEVLEQVLPGADHHVGNAAADGDKHANATDVIVKIVQQRLEHRRRRRRN